MKTIEKPMINSDVVLRVRAARAKVTVPPRNSTTSIPVTTDRYAGTNGSTHGERKEIMPPPKATIYPAAKDIATL
jgi:hypothetical protein